MTPRYKLHQRKDMVKDQCYEKTFKLGRKQNLETIQFTFIRPILEYGDVVWNNCSQHEKDELKKIQIQAARIAMWATK